MLVPVNTKLASVDAAVYMVYSQHRVYATQTAPAGVAPGVISVAYTLWTTYCYVCAEGGGGC
jgi:hypothetical protein